jgi:hypothetical protein
MGRLHTSLLSRLQTGSECSGGGGGGDGRVVLCVCVCVCVSCTRKVSPANFGEANFMWSGHLDLRCVCAESSRCVVPSVCLSGNVPKLHSHTQRQYRPEFKQDRLHSRSKSGREPHSFRLKYNGLLIVGFCICCVCIH